MNKIFKLLLYLLPTQVIHPKTHVVKMSESGTLSHHITSKEKNHIVSLKIIGPINNADFQYICAMAGNTSNKKQQGALSVLDLSDAVFYNKQSCVLSSYLFCNCKNLTKITLPKNATRIETNAFCGCSKLTTIIVPSENTHYTDIEGVLFNKDKSDLIFYPKGRSGIYFIPSSVRQLRPYTFQNCKKLTSIVIPTSVALIMKEAFAGCFHLKEIHCLSTLPPQCQGRSCFEGIKKTSCTLYIPLGAYSHYWLSQTWGQFINIKEKNYANISTINNQQHTN